MKLTRQGLLTSILVVAALFVGAALTSWIPTANDVFERPFRHTASVGDAVDLRTGTVTVTQVRTAKELRLRGQRAVTTGVWVVLDLSWRARDKPTQLSLLHLRIQAADGRTYGGLPAFVPPCGLGQPGIEKRCQVQFELPADALAGTRVLIPASVTLTGSDDVADIDLGIDDASAASLAAPSEPITLDEGSEGA